MSIQIRDPLSLLPYQSGLISPPLEASAAKGNSKLDVQQKAVEIGETIPIVFGRRVSNIGGVFVSPGATEGRFANDAVTNDLSLKLRLVLSEGQLDLLGATDLFQGPCRRGTWNQVYNQRAGTWSPGNLIVAVAGKELWDCPVYCGTNGSYGGLTTLSYETTHLDGDEDWNKQIHVFVRGGIRVTRILDSIVGPSNNVIDLALYLIRESSRFPETLLDLDAMEDAALFCDVNGLFYNGEFKDSTNLEDWLEGISSNFLLRVSDKEGKKGLRPRLPVNNDGTINTTKIAWVYTFTEDQLLPDGFEIDYIGLADRKPICAQMLWRQQPDDDIGFIRTLEVRMEGLAPDGPYEQYDMTQFCASENHAAKIGAYRVAARHYITHTLRLRVSPDTFNTFLTTGDIVRVRLRRETTSGTVDFHDYLYEVERIGKNVSGVVDLDLIHFPIDAQGRSLLALAVIDAVGNGIVIPTGRTDFSCDAGATIDDDGIAGTGGGGGGYGVPIGQQGDPDGAIDNPIEPPLGAAITGASGDDGQPIVDDELSYDPGCAGAFIEWYLVNAAGARTKVSEGVAASYIVKPPDIDNQVLGIGACPDPGSPTGYGTLVESAFTEPVEPNILSYAYVRWNGQLVSDGSTTNYTSAWSNITGFTSSDFLTIGPLSACSFLTNVGFIAPGTDARFSSVPAIGPIAWRAQVSVTTSGLGPLTGEFGLGGLGLNQNALNTCAAILPAVKFAIGSSSSATYSVTGKWEFSDNASTVLAEWEGRSE
jgi:hypothetical protein